MIFYWQLQVPWHLAFASFDADLKMMILRVSKVVMRKNLTIFLMMINMIQKILLLMMPSWLVLHFLLFCYFSLVSLITFQT